METATVYFSDGNTLRIHEGQRFIPLVMLDKKVDNLWSPSQSQEMELWDHGDAGLVPSFLELLFNSKFFYEAGKEKIIFNSAAVTRIEHD